MASFIAGGRSSPAPEFIDCSTRDCEAAVHGRALLTIFSFFSLLPALFGVASAQGTPSGGVVRRVVIQDEVIWRVPVRPHVRGPAVEWGERKGPKCIPAGTIRGANLGGSEHVDFVLFDRSRIRAKFDDDCPALDFYGGFYLKPEDEMLCARRDSVHSRMGSSCRIERFRRLVPKLKD